MHTTYYATASSHDKQSVARAVKQVFTLETSDRVAAGARSALGLALRWIVAAQFKKKRVTPTLPAFTASKVPFNVPALPGGCRTHGRRVSLTCTVNRSRRQRRDHDGRANRSTRTKKKASRQMDQADRDPLPSCTDSSMLGASW